ncbi:hypothetical protein KRR38_14670 [Novosphingobium sp. G106]|uniref:hypothetical protein n=1 Tax=Novosphingobium sp. G106 TaxID=2849500 RepID=UPI001C2D15F6|nr:hypothetical protein [Novosphingobium sp. G106]MBV1688881.1 hypothetical protein [Novosphingobium sp. G106]
MVLRALGLQSDIQGFLERCIVGSRTHPAMFDKYIRRLLYAALGSSVHAENLLAFVKSHDAEREHFRSALILRLFCVGTNQRAPASQRGRQMRGEKFAERPLCRTERFCLLVARHRDPDIAAAGLDYPENHEMGKTGREQEIATKRIVGQLAPAGELFILISPSRLHAEIMDGIKRREFAQIAAGDPVGRLAAGNLHFFGRMPFDPSEDQISVTRANGFPKKWNEGPPGPILDCALLGSQQQRLEFAIRHHRNSSHHMGVSIAMPPCT